MDLLNGGGNGKNGGNGKGGGGAKEPQAEQPKPTDAQLMKQFADEFNGILQKGYPMTVVLSILESAVFEIRFNLYLAQMELQERAKKTQIQIPKNVIPTGKIK